jgi:hypothetical protein
MPELLGAAVARHVTIAARAVGFFLLGAANAEPLHIFVASYFGFGEFAVFLYDDAYRHAHDTQVKYND